jgi:DNA-binding NarL/FixJ family response regulator
MKTAHVSSHPVGTTRVVVVDDHTIMRDGLSALLESVPDLEVVGTAADGRSAIETVEREKPNVVLMDLSMPRTDGTKAIRVIKQKAPNVRIVVLTFHKGDAYIHAALKAGADAYVLKDDGRVELLAAIRNVAAGKGYLSPSICSRVISSYVGRNEPAQELGRVASWEILTPRELEVLQLVAEGYKTREIADYLSLSVKTIVKHRARMMQKLELSNVAAVTAYAIDNGLITQ